MKFTVLALFALATLAYARNIDQVEYLDDNTAYGYNTRYGIPLAEKIRQAEEEYANNPSSRIVGGSAARLGDFPFQAGLLGHFSSGQGVCGGSLVRANRVLTAAHCWFDGVNQAQRFTVVLGSITLFSGGTRMDSNSVAMHPNWNPQLIRNDVAMIYMPSNAPLSNNIALIALPSGNELTNLHVGATATASGFGLTRDGGSIAANQFLSTVSMPIITNAQCSLSFPVIIQASNLCTNTAGGRSTCQGDSGGPLTVISNNRRLLVGVVSFGSARGCQIGAPAAFARVSSFMPFIQSHM